MANEITLTAGLKVSKNGAGLDSGILTKQVTMTGNELIDKTQLIGTSAEAITWGDISGAPGCVQIKNLDATNFVRVSLGDDANYFAKIRPGHFAQFEPASSTMYAKADTASVRVQIRAVEV